MQTVTRRDLVVAVLFVLVLLMLVAGLMGAHRVFAYAVVAWLSALAGLGFARLGEPPTWIAALLVCAGLSIGMTGVLLNESAVVSGATDTLLGFHPGTAFLVYGIWAPGLFTLGVSFVLLFDRLFESGNDSS